MVRKKDAHPFIKAETRSPSTVIGIFLIAFHSQKDQLQWNLDL